MTAGKSSFLPPVSKSSTHLTVCKTNLAGVRNVVLLSEKGVGITTISHDRCITQHALSVVQKPQFPLSLEKGALSIAVNATSSKEKHNKFFVWLDSPEEMATEITEASFATDAERQAFIDRYTPFSVPDDISEISITFVSWLDWNLDTNFILPAGKTDAFLNELRQLDPSGVKDFSFKTDVSVGNVYVTGRKVKIVCSNPPPKSD